MCVVSVCVYCQLLTAKADVLLMLLTLMMITGIVMTAFKTRRHHVTSSPSNGRVLACLRVGLVCGWRHTDGQLLSVCASPCACADTRALMLVFLVDCVRFRALIPFSFISHALLARLFWVDLIKPRSQMSVCPYVRPSVRPQNVYSISMKFGV